MTEADIEIIMQGAKEKYPEARPRIISDNGPQFIAKDFKEFIRISGMTHAWRDSRPASAPSHLSPGGGTYSLPRSLPASRPLGLPVALIHPSG